MKKNGYRAASPLVQLEMELHKATKVAVDIASIFTILTVLLSSVSGEDFCYVTDKNPYLYFGTKTSYHLVRAREMKILEPSKCTPVYVWALIRHGTRYGKRKSFTNLLNLKERIISNHDVDKRGSLCPGDLNNLRQWTYSWSVDMDNQLTSEGRVELTSLAKRIHAKFAVLFSSPQSTFVFESGSKQRVKDSLTTFRKAFYELADDDKANTYNIKTNDTLLHFLPDSKEWHKKVVDNPDTRREENRFAESTYIQQLLIDVSNRLGFKEPLSLDDVEQMYTMCAFETAHVPNSKPAFCAAFTPSQLMLLEYLFFELNSYYKLGYGSTFNVEIPNPAIADMITKLIRVANAENGTQRGAFYFTHAEIIIPSILKLGLYRDKEPLRHDNFETMKQNRKWVVSHLSPFMANIIAVLYKCIGENEFKVMLYLNEYVIEYPNCPGGICALSLLQEKFKKEVKGIEEAAQSWFCRAVKCILTFGSQILNSISSFIRTKIVRFI